MRRVKIALCGFVALALLGLSACAAMPHPSVQPSQAPESSAPSAAPSPSPRPSPSPSPLQPSPSPEPTSAPLPLSGLVIGLDPGHQAKGNSGKEPVAPGSSEKKAKVTSGTQGKWSKVPEHEVNLKVALLVRDLLEEQGATVVMTRQTADVDISNVERAQFFNDQKTDFALRLHCNGSENSSDHGAFVIVPTEGEHKKQCDAAAKKLIDAYCAETGAKNMGLRAMGNQTGFNWCNRMVINIEMGYMTNKEEDALLTDSDYQVKMAQGICNGILAYYEK